MKLWRIIPFLVLVGIMGTAFFGAATQLTVDGTTLIAGKGEVDRCDDRVEIFWRTDFSKPINQIVLKGVTIAGVNSACDGMGVRVVVTDKAGNKLALAKAKIDAANNTKIDFEWCNQDDFNVDTKEPVNPQANCMPPAFLVNGVHVSISDN